ncbi:ABC transporter ATP-binding protein [Actinomadura sp. 6N118]|uniref:ABC transporter ATP-binding protein n=1 Tax=Actinomadura sp. 6N118 TaxID=3375151 RepID=UPI0037BBE7F7
MIVTRTLTKRFGRITAVNEVDLNVREGDRYGLLGPNGSGKTTLVRMILGLVYATSGEIEVMGRPIPRRTNEVLREVGALVEGPGAYGHLSGRANLTFLDAAGPGGGGSRKARRIRVEEALTRVGLSGVDDRPVKTYSLGMRQRLGLAAALLHQPRLLVLDEPTNGLDPQGIREIRDLLEELNANGTTIFLCSHLLSEVEQLCTRVGVMDRGHLVLEEKMSEIRSPTGRVVVHTPDADRAVALLDGGVEHRDGARLLVRTADAAELNARLVREGLRIDEIHVQRRSLEDVVLEATGPGSDRLDSEPAELDEPGVRVDGVRKVEARPSPGTNNSTSPSASTSLSPGSEPDAWQGTSREFLE